MINSTVFFFKHFVAKTLPKFVYFQNSLLYKHNTVKIISYNNNLITMYKCCELLIDNTVNN